MNWIVEYKSAPRECLVELPPSKSIAARAMMLGANIGEQTVLCDDLSVLRNALKITTGNVHTGSSGTAFRFLTAHYAAMPGSDVVLDGTPQLRTRPIAALVDALRSIGAEISYLGQEGLAPLRIVGKRLRGGRVEIDASVSSQYISALLLAAPLMEEGIEIVAAGLTSEPYIDMTSAVCKEAGIDAGRKGNIFYAHVEKGKSYSLRDFPIEADWSAASYFMEIAALVKSTITFEGLAAGDVSIQGDANSAELFASLGSASTISADMRGMPDIVPALAVGCALRGVPFRLTGLGTLRVKECDRIDAIRCGLRHLGFAVDAGDDWLCWDGSLCPDEKTMTIDAFDDHRIVMAFAPAAILAPVTIKGAECVSKSFPDFAAQISKCGFVVNELNTSEL